MKILILVITVALMGYGCYLLYVSLTNLEPTELTIDEYIEQRPKEKWLSLDKCSLDLVEASYEETFGSKIGSTVFIPIRSMDSTGEEPIVAFLESEDPEIVALVREVNSYEDDQDLEDYVLENLDKVLLVRKVSGMVRYGLDHESDIEDGLREVNSNVAEEFVVIREDAKPSRIAPVLMLVFAFGLSLATWQIFRKKPVAAANPAPPASV